MSDETVDKQTDIVDTCPNCGAPKQYSNDTLTGYECGSNLYVNGLAASEACEYAASLRTERDKYKQALERIAENPYNNGACCRAECPEIAEQALEQTK